MDHFYHIGHIFVSLGHLFGHGEPAGVFHQNAFFCQLPLDGSALARFFGGFSA